MLLKSQLVRGPLYPVTDRMVDVPIRTFRFARVPLSSPLRTADPAMPVQKDEGQASEQDHH